MSEWKLYRKSALQEMRPYIEGEDLSGVSVNAEDSPEPGGMIARNAKNHADQWYVAKAFFGDNYESAESAPEEAFVRHIAGHLHAGQEVICKICGKTAKEICAEARKPAAGQG